MLRSGSDRLLTVKLEMAYNFIVQGADLPKEGAKVKD